MIDENIFLFIGLTSVLVGGVLLIYTLSIWLAHRKAIKQSQVIDVRKSAEAEMRIQPTIFPTQQSFSQPSSPGSMPSYQAPSSIQPVQSGAYTEATPAITLTSATSRSEQEWIVALENLIRQHSMQTITDEMFIQRRQALLTQRGSTNPVSTPSVPTSPNTPKVYTSQAELLIDRAEGIITAQEYEQLKVRFTQKADSAS